MTAPYYQDGHVTLYHGDVADVLPTIGGADLIVTDPPYTFGIASTDQLSSKNGGWGDLMNSATWYASWLKECRRMVENRSGAAWVFCSWRMFPVLARASFLANWSIQSLLIWDKGMLGPSGRNSLRWSYEQVALFSEPKFDIANRSLTDIWRILPVPPTSRAHPAEKPVALLRKIIRESLGSSSYLERGFPRTLGRVVVDPFVGSGSTLVAAKAEGHHAIGVEIEERYCEIAARRLVQGPLELAASDV